MRLRIRFTKHGKVRFTSHRDIARIWERAVRRAELPIAYTEGFSPRPKMHFGLALSTGHESDAEYLDIDLDVQADAPPPSSSSTHCPNASRRAPRRDPGHRVRQCRTWCTVAAGGRDPLHVADELLGLAGRAPATGRPILAADQLPLRRVRKGNERVDDARPAILAVEIDEPDSSGGTLHVELATQPRSLRPAEFSSCSRCR